MVEDIDVETPLTVLTFQRCARTGFWRTPETNFQQIISATGYPIKMIRQIHIVVSY